MKFAESILRVENQHVGMQTESEPARIVCGGRLRNVLIAELIQMIEQSGLVEREDNSIGETELAGILFRAGVNRSTDVARDLLREFKIERRNG